MAMLTTGSGHLYVCVCLYAHGCLVEPDWFTPLCLSVIPDSASPPGLLHQRSAFYLPALSLPILPSRYAAINKPVAVLYWLDHNPDVTATGATACSLVTFGSIISHLCLPLRSVYRCPLCPPHPPSRYVAINKPVGVLYWLEHSPDARSAEWVLILDADQLLRRPILPWELGAERGHPVSAEYGYAWVTNVTGGCRRVSSR